MAHSDNTYFRIVDALHAGVFDEGRWRGGLELIHDYFGANGMALYSVHPTLGTLYRFDIVHVDPDLTTAYVRDWIAHDPRYQAGHTLCDGEVVTEQQLVDWRKFVKTPVYNEFLLPAQIPRHMASWLHRRRDRGVFIGLQRTHARGAFSDACRERLSRLVPHLRRTVEMKDRLALAQLTAESFSEGMDRLSMAVLLLDSQLRVSRASHSAELLLAAGLGIKVERGRLDFSNPADRRRFLAVLREDPAVAKQRDVMPVSRGAGMTPLSLSLLPLPTSAETWLACTARWMVLIHAPEMQAPVPTDRIRLTLGITHAEAVLVQCLLEGQTLKHAAGNLGISPHTARAQLKTVYSKTGLNSQTQLIRALLMNPLVAEH